MPGMSGTPPRVTSASTATSNSSTLTSRSAVSPSQPRSRALRSAFLARTRPGFRFTCDADRIDYWLRYGRPVVLICVNLLHQRAWWKRLDTWFADPARRARRVVEFDKAADRFDLAAFSSLAATRGAGRAAFAPA